MERVQGRKNFLKMLGVRPWDFLPALLTVIATVAITWAGANQLQGERRVEIQTQDGLSTYPLTVDRHFASRGPLGESYLRIENGQVSFDSSPCSNQVCVQMGLKQEAGEWAACLPNRVLFRLVGGGEALDVLSQ